MAPVWRAVFGIAVGVTHNAKWALTDSEADNLGAATCRVLDRYIPALFERCPELIGLGLTLVMVIAGKAGRPDEPIEAPAAPAAPAPIRGIQAVR